MAKVAPTVGSVGHWGEPGVGDVRPEYMWGGDREEQDVAVVQ